MRKPELAAAIAEKADLSKDQANRVLNAVLDEITYALNRKDSVTPFSFYSYHSFRHRVSIHRVSILRCYNSLHRIIRINLGFFSITRRLFKSGSIFIA